MIIILDTETTGIYPRDEWAEVVELAAVMLDSGLTEVSHFTSLVKPKVLDERCDGALAVNHITREMLADAPGARDVAVAFAAWAKPWRDRVKAVQSYNIDFDRPMVERMGLRGVPWGECVMKGAMEPMAEAGLLKKKTYPKEHEGITGVYLFPKLSMCCEHFEVKVDGDAHRALTDARAAAKVWAAVMAWRKVRAVLGKEVSNG